MNKRYRILNSVVLTALLFSITFQAVASVRPERWRWSNPAPHGNNVLDMYVNGDIAMQVGDGGTLYIQRSDERWEPIYTGVETYLRSATMLGSKYLVSGENGTLLWSDDGTHFQQAQLSPTTLNWFEGLTASGQAAVAVGDEGFIYHSTDGISWNKVASGTTEWFRGVASGGNAFVAVGENGTIARSQNGTSWNTVAVNTTEHLNRVRYLGTSNNGAFYAVGNNGACFSSQSGTAPWTELPTNSTNDLNDVALNSAGLLVVGNNEILFQPNGSTTWEDQILSLSSNAPPAWEYLSAQGAKDAWLVAGRTGLLMEGSLTTSNSFSWEQTPSGSSHAWLWDVTIQDGLYIAVGDLAIIQTSLDGLLWTREKVPDVYTNSVWLGVGGTSNLVLAVGSDGNVAQSEAAYTTITRTNQIGNATVTTNISVNLLGISWTNQPAFTDRTLQGIDATDNLFIVSGADGKIFTSPSGTSWAEQATPLSDFLSSVAIGPSSCVASGKNGALLVSNQSATSWSKINLGITAWIYRVRWLNNQFIAVGEGGLIYTSPDGQTWTARTSGTTKWLTDITYVDGQWFISGYQGTLLTSPDTITWTPTPLPSKKSFYSAASNEGQLIVAGVEGIILRNQIVSSTNAVQVLGYDQSIVISGTSTNAYELFLFGGEPDQLFGFQSITNLGSSQWNTQSNMEIFDSSGTIYLLQTRDANDLPETEFFRAKRIP